MSIRELLRAPHTLAFSLAFLPASLLAALPLSLSLSLPPATAAAGTATAPQPPTPTPTPPAAVPLKPTDLFALRTGLDPQISPDGRHIVYVQMHADIIQDEFQPTLWIIDADGRNAHPLTDPKESAGNPRWSPDGTRIAFIATRNGARQIVVHWIANSVEIPIGGLVSPPANLEWSPDGKLLAFSMLEPAAPRIIGTLPAEPPGASWKPKPVVIDRALYRADAEGYLPAGQNQLFVVPADGGAVRRITAPASGDLPLIGRPYDWDADSQALIAALVHHNEAEILHGDLFDSGIYRVPVNGGPPQKLIDRNGPEQWPSASPDGRWIAYSGYDEKRQSYTVSQLFVLDRRTGERRSITASLDRDVVAPRWAPDGKGIYAYFADHGVNRLVLFDLKNGYRPISGNLGTPMTAYTAEPSFSVARDGTIAFQWSTATASGDIGIVRSDGGGARRLTDLNDSLLNAHSIGKVQELNFQSSFDRLPIQGWLLYPPGFDPGRRYPLILEIHGGPAAGYGPYLDIEKQLMASAGFIVLYLNPRGSTGYGESFGNLLQDDYPGHELEDLMSGLDAALARGSVDPQRLYVTGGSGGGTLTAWLICHTNRFRAAAVLYPVIDWQSEALTSDILPLVFNGFFHGTPWSQADRYRRHSLLTDIDKVRTPALVMTGEMDFRTPISESEQYFAALRYHGVESVFVRMPQENHGLRAYPSHFAAKVPLITGWFDEHR